MKAYQISPGNYRFYAGSLTKNILIDFRLRSIGLGFSLSFRDGLTLRLFIGPIHVSLLWNKGS